MLLNDPALKIKMPKRQKLEGDHKSKIEDIRGCCWLYALLTGLPPVRYI